MATTHSELLKECDYKNNKITQEGVSSGSEKKVWWLCDKGHSYDMSVLNKLKSKSCPYFVGRKVLYGFNDVATTTPEILEYWDFEKKLLNLLK